jgi:LmbE family N-acetylglucosaminyl deacetylase
MRFNARADILVPDGIPLEEALRRTSHLGIGAHQDDLEIMAFHGIAACFHSDHLWFTGVTCTDGAGSPRGGPYQAYSGARIQPLRCTEQRNAAQIGRYSAMIQLGYPSDTVKDPGEACLREDLTRLLSLSRPEFVYTHNLADRHATHVAVALRVIDAIRALPAACRPRQVYGCEVWRSLDWLPADRRVVLDVSGHDHLAATLIGLYDTQLAGGKRYDLATLGRRRAHATYLESHALDKAEQVILAMDLTPPALDPELDLAEYLGGLAGRFQDELQSMLNRLRKSSSAFP